jgi:hypothetical protein
MSTLSGGGAPDDGVVDADVVYLPADSLDAAVYIFDPGDSLKWLANTSQQSKEMIIPT